MRSLRLDPELDEKVQRAAAVKGESVSEFIRQAAAERADQTLRTRPSELFADVAGVVHGGGGRARKSGKAFIDTLARAHAKR
jgi:predicted transcriptional regulator